MREFHVKQREKTARSVRNCSGKRDAGSRLKYRLVKKLEHSAPLDIDLLLRASITLNGTSDTAKESNSTATKLQSRVLPGVQARRTSHKSICGHLWDLRSKFDPSRSILEKQVSAEPAYDVLPTRATDLVGWCGTLWQTVIDKSVAKICKSTRSMRYGQGGLRVSDVWVLR
jgi:hypothetical protein